MVKINEIAGPVHRQIHILPGAGASRTKPTWARDDGSSGARLVLLVFFSCSLPFIPCSCFVFGGFYYF
jgi:hypothetical protein